MKRACSLLAACWGVALLGGKYVNDVRSVRMAWWPSGEKCINDVTMIDEKLKKLYETFRIYALVESFCARLYHLIVLWSHVDKRDTRWTVPRCVLVLLDQLMCINIYKLVAEPCVFSLNNIDRIQQTFLYWLMIPRVYWEMKAWTVKDVRWANYTVPSGNQSLYFKWLLWF